ncbi:unnamed protein product [Pelagomonas calceolata]|uniref:Histone RNA hairpin-binding protein RNA-binding domain-containing protein n=2 Tax=Pelagomonas calceolata TaxID=35677 RepID=A0A8J2SNK5_9STRA|nr:unnamed protein product [Pelagomonas calceolata]
MEPYYLDRQPMQRRSRSRSRSRERSAASPRGAARSRHEQPPQPRGPRMQHNERETDPRRLSQRRKEIAYGKNTLGYERYLRLVPKEKRRHPRDHPPTPDPTRKYSKRQFDGIVRAWRRKLHDWDPPKSEQDLGPAVAPMIPTLAATPAPAPPAAPAPAPAPPKPVDDDFGPDVFAVDVAAPSSEPPVAAAEPVPAADTTRTAPAHDDVSDDDLL